MINKRNSYAALLAAAVVLAAVTAGAAVLVDCPAVGNGLDFIYRGFYVPDFPGSSIDRVVLRFRALSSDFAGPTTLRLTIREGTFDGPLAGQAETTADLPALGYQQVVFSFPPAAVTPGAVVTFTMENLSGNDDEVYFSVTTDEAACPVVETNGTTPPLDSFRRNGVVVTIYGDESVAAETGSWSALKGFYR